MFKLTDYVMSLTPLGVFGAMAGVRVAPRPVGPRLLRQARRLALRRAGPVHAARPDPALLSSRAGPRIFFRKIREPFLLAFSTASSEAALPRALEKMVEFGVPESVAGFVIPAGYSFNLDGSTLYISLAALTIAQAAGVKMSLGPRS